MYPMFSGQLEFLSNFYTLPEPIFMYGKPYPTVEHAYQAAKAISKTDRELICSASTAGYAKKLGRMVNCRHDFEQIKIEVMIELIKRKFATQSLQEMLASTKDLYLIETNYWHDNFWGDCCCKECGNIKGENHLGIILMQRRFHLLHENSEDSNH